MSTSKRERLRRERIRQAQREKRRRRLVVASVGLVVVIAAVSTVLFQMNRTTATSYAGALAPVTVQADGTVTMATAGTTKPVLDVYEDFQCPICKEFERINGAQIKRFAAEGKIKVVYHPIAFVNPQGSLRAAAAAQCVPAVSWMAYHDELFARQPDERVALTVDDLKRFAAKAGVTDPAVLSCMASQSHAAQVRQRTQTAFSSPDFHGTPTLLLDGVKVDDDATLTSSGLRGVLEKATA
ncbi:thioredoxin domain-containing protein [Microbispora sp. RL4-1S]|uniref:Thioredoxin domain-containing protein n=1 Tax=Microbispora oryzae TaxID=2806554 RepID=A0A941AS92_9ACTN|nr:thioredoxin domain-containing protein [Microbispora oryzae]MBP2707699.1 thioredoxin domain-containing protein [Microbispora oryzae]